MADKQITPTKPASSSSSPKKDAATRVSKKIGKKMGKKVGKKMGK